MQGACGWLLAIPSIGVSYLNLLHTPFLLITFQMPDVCILYLLILAHSEHWPWATVWTERFPFGIGLFNILDILRVVILQHCCSRILPLLPITCP